MKALQVKVRRERPRAVAEQPVLDAPGRLAREVRGLRQAHGMTQRQLAARSGVQQAEISRIEAGRSNPTLSTISALAHALDADLSLAARTRGSSARLGRSSGAVAAPRRAELGPAAARPTRFLCLICAERLMEDLTRAEAERHRAQYRVYTARLRRRGQLVACNRLLPAETAATVRVRKGRVTVTDGPFAETKELVGGYFVIEARDRAEAVRVAAGIPGARLGCVEVRPIAEDPATRRALGLDAEPGPG